MIVVYTHINCNSFGTMFCVQHAYITFTTYVFIVTVKSEVAPAFYRIEMLILRLKLLNC